MDGQTDPACSSAIRFRVRLIAASAAQAALELSFDTLRHAYLTIAVLARQNRLASSRCRDMPHVQRIGSTRHAGGGDWSRDGTGCH
jgi:hypothetical protein